MYHFVDFLTKQQVHPASFAFTGDFGPWEVMMDLEKIRQKIDVAAFKKTAPSIRKYLPFFPIENGSEMVSVGEAPTPLVKSETLAKQFGIDLHFKLEGKNPTGSFKDRGSVIDISVAKALKAPGIVLASTGNMAASCACYAAKAKLPCFVFVPEGAPLAKLAQVLIFGGKLVQVKGTFHDAMQLALPVAKELGFFLAGDYAFRVEGQKAAVFELIDQMNWEVPDAIVMPLGSGTNMGAYAKGFLEYRKLGLIDKTPMLIGVQATGSCPIVTAFENSTMDIKPLQCADTIASAIAVEAPVDGVKALDAIYSSGGKAYAVSDEEMVRAQKKLAREEGLFVETASAASIAAIERLAEDASFKGKKIVAVLSGDGLKDTHLLVKNARHVPVIHPQKEEFLSLYEKGAFDDDRYQSSASGKEWIEEALFSNSLNSLLGT